MSANCARRFPGRLAQALSLCCVLGCAHTRTLKLLLGNTRSTTNDRTAAMPATDQPAPVVAVSEPKGSQQVDSKVTPTACQSSDQRAATGDYITRVAQQTSERL